MIAGPGIVKLIDGVKVGTGLLKVSKFLGDIEELWIFQRRGAECSM